MKTLSPKVGVLIIALILTALSTVSFAKGHDTYLVIRPYVSELSATIAASNRFNPTSIKQDTEYMGVILKKEGLYYYTYTRGHKGKHEVSTLMPDAEYGQVVAIWHTHGKAVLRHQFFSPSDTRLANKYKMPIYLADYTGQLKIFRPGGKTLSLLAARRTGQHSLRGVAKGELVKHPTGKVVTVAVRTVEKLENDAEIKLAAL